MDKPDKVEYAKQVDLVEYMRAQGFSFTKKGKYYICSSPFAKDSTPSFKVYPNNSFYCWATGKGGDSIKLVEELFKTSFKEAVDKLVKFGESSGVMFDPTLISFPKISLPIDIPFDPDPYITNDATDCVAIYDYAKGRKVKGNFEYCRFHSGESPQLAVGFLHKSKTGTIIGLKMRNINPKSPAKFKYAGTSGGAYVISHTGHGMKNDLHRGFLVEGEINANSLYYFLLENFPQLTFTVASGGGVNNIPRVLPFNADRSYVIIDYDNDEELYQERLEPYLKLNLKPIKLMLEKGQDINSLYINNLLTIKHLKPN